MRTNITELGQTLPNLVQAPRTVLPTLPVAFFGDAAPETRVNLAGRGVAIGMAGLQAMGVAGHIELVELVELVEREFAKLAP
ncbi:MAG: hypothetical protein ACP5VR_13335 [Acidimicrobiales bacterium]